MRISFVVLHYITINDTIECVNSILTNISYENLDIVIVDNGSPNNSGSEIEKLYSKNNRVHFIKSPENLGFAKGNNIGFRYAKYKLKSDFIIMINNDIIINQKYFCNNIVKKYNESKFAVMGPDIVSLINNLHQNPIPRMFTTSEDVKKRKKKYEALNFLSYFYLDNLASKFYSKINNKKQVSNKAQIKNIQLHGSCLIFSPIYIKKFDGLYEKTFMYMEESILKYICDKNKLEMIYYPSIVVYHKEDSSTNAAIKKEIKKRRFYYKNSINSCEVLLNMINENSII